MDNDKVVRMSKPREVSVEDYSLVRRARALELDRMDPLVTLKLGGIMYTLEFDNRAVKDVLKDTKLNLLSENIPLEYINDPEKISALLFRGLQKYHPDMTVDKVDSLYSVRQYTYLIAKLREALDVFMPDMSDMFVKSEPKEAEVEGANPTQQTASGSGTTE